MKIKKIYSFSNQRQIWRIITTETGKIIIEDRDVEKKQVYFNAIDENTGKVVFRNHQLEEKFWIGIEAIYKDIILFHKFGKPDLPAHKVIIAFDISAQKIMWESDEYSFLFIYEDALYVYKQKFEGRVYYKLNIPTGDLVSELGSDDTEIKAINAKLYDVDKYKNYYFPVSLSGQFEENKITEIISSKTKGLIVEGNIEYVLFHQLLLFNFYKKKSDGFLSNEFYVVDMLNNKILLEDILNKSARAFVPDSFFIKDDNLYILKERNTLLTYKIF